MDLVPIGEFARLSRLSPKALRLYDQLALRCPRRLGRPARPPAAAGVRQIYLHDPTYGGTSAYGDFAIPLR
jgi:hypothetical protein